MILFYLRFRDKFVNIIFYNNKAIREIRWLYCCIYLRLVFNASYTEAKY